jgi:hypothetical protein
MFHIIFTRIFLCRVFKEINFFCTTADAWSSSGRSFVALTVHWIDKKTRERKMGVLACNRIEGTQSFEKLAELMSDVHAKFGLEGKIVRTVTDNGANFVKSFREFGPRSRIAAHRPPAEDMDDVEEVLPSQPQPLERNEREDGADGGHDVDDEIEEEDLEYVHVADILAEGSEHGGLYKLPQHLRCAAHTMNLVATTDVRNVLENDSLHKSAIDQKANDLWKKQRASPGSVEVIVKHMGRRLLTPGQTRWNSKYDALVCLSALMEGEKTRQVRFFMYLRRSLC